MRHLGPATVPGSTHTERKDATYYRLLSIAPRLWTIVMCTANAVEQRQY